MTTKIIPELKAAHEVYTQLRDAHTPAIVAAAENYRTKIHSAYNDMYGDKRKGYDHAWLISDRIYVNDDLGIEFWEDGRCGNSDELVDTIPLTEDIFTEEGLQKLADEWVTNEKIRISDKERAVALEKQNKIKSLEAELSKLTQP